MSGTSGMSVSAPSSASGVFTLIASVRPSMPQPNRRTRRHAQGAVYCVVVSFRRLVLAIDSR